MQCQDEGHKEQRERLAQEGDASCLWNDVRIQKVNRSRPKRCAYDISIMETG